MRFDIFTLFPAMFGGPFGESIIHRAINAGLVEVHTHNVRDYTTDKHHITDDYPYGGGGGMLMKPDPIFAAVESVLEIPPITADAPPHAGAARCPVILMSPAGRRFNHTIAQELAKQPRIALICGHYEGVDERVRTHLCTDEISIGDFVLTGGELAAMMIVDAVARQLPGVLAPGAAANESHTSAGQLEYPHYTRPANFRGWTVPEVLIGGNHAKIEQWRREQSALISQKRAPAAPSDPTE